ncbi:hypothetical protein ACQ4WX_36295 [Streptomyces lasalocidi]
MWAPHGRQNKEFWPRWAVFETAVHRADVYAMAGLPFTPSHGGRPGLRGLLSGRLRGARGEAVPVAPVRRGAPRRTDAVLPLDAGVGEQPVELAGHLRRGGRRGDPGGPGRYAGGRHRDRRTGGSAAGRQGAAAADEPAHDGAGRP